MHYALNYLQSTLVHYITNTLKKVSNKSYKYQLKLFYDIASYSDYANYWQIPGLDSWQGQEYSLPYNVHMALAPTPPSVQ